MLIWLHVGLLEAEGRYEKLMYESVPIDLITSINCGELVMQNAWVPAALVASQLALRVELVVFAFSTQPMRWLASKLLRAVPIAP